MKTRIIFAFWMAFALVLTMVKPASADVIMPNTHHVDFAVKFVNLDKFPDIILIAHGYFAPFGNVFTDYEYVIANDSPLTKQYHMDKLTVYWATKDKINSINKVDPEKAVGVFDPTMGNDYGYVPDSLPLIQQTVEYSLAGFNGTKLLYYKSRQVSYFNDGTPTKDETFQNPWVNLSLNISPPPSPSPVQLPEIPPPTLTPSTTIPTVNITPPIQGPGDMNTIDVTPPVVDVIPPANPLPPPPQTFLESLSYEAKFLVALALTLVIEIPVAVMALWYWFKRKEIPRGKIVTAGLVASGLTLPYLWFILPAFIPNPFIYIAVGEVSVFLVETFIYVWLLKVNLRQALAVSFLANAASFAAGLILL